MEPIKINRGPDVIEFDPELHRYTVNGFHYPGVTSVIEFFLNNYASVPDQVLEPAADLGRKVHKATLLHDRGVLDYDSVDVAIWPYLAAWDRFKRDFHVSTIEREYFVYSKIYRYAGTLDVIAMVKDHRTLIDIKTGGKVSGHELQVAAYAAAWDRENTGMRINRMATVYLSPDKYHPEFYPIPDYKESFGVFAGMVRTYQYLMDKGKIK